MLAQVAWAENAPFKPLASAPSSDDELFFKVSDGEAKIDGEVIKLIVVKPKHLSVSYKNDSQKELFPKYTVSTYNRYGYLLGKDTVGTTFFGGSPQLEPGDVGGEKINLDLVDLANIFKYTGLELPDDFYAVAWVSIADSNSRLMKQNNGPDGDSGETLSH